jgi:hypothetical protein
MLGERMRANVHDKIRGELLGLDVSSAEWRSEKSMIEAVMHTLARA